MSQAPPSTSRPRVVPVWLDRMAAIGWRVLAIAALGLVLVAIALLLATVVASIVLSLVVAAPLVPLVVALRRRGLSRSLASAAACGIGLLVMAGIALLLVAAFLPYLRDMVSFVTDGVGEISRWLASIGAPQAVIDAFDRVVDGIRGALGVNIAAVVGDAVTIGTVLVLSFFLLFFLLQDGDRGWAWLTNQLETWQAETLTASVVRAVGRVGAFVQRTVLLAAADAVVAFILLTILGIPFTGPLVAVVFLGGFIPYLGAIVTTMAVGLSILSLVGVVPALVVVGGLCIAAFLENRALAGTTLGSRGDIHPAIVLIAIPIGATFFGIFGLVTVIPVVLFVLTIIRPILDTLDLGPAMAAATRPGGPSWAVPGWLDRLGQWSWRSLVGAGMLFVAIRIIVAVPVIVVPVVLAIVIAATLLPMVQVLLRARWDRTLAVATTTIGAAVAIIAALVLTIVWTIGPLREILATADIGAQDIDVDWLSSAVGQVSAVVSVTTAEVLRSVIAVGFAVVLFGLLVFFFLRDGGMFWDAATDRLRGARREHLDEAGERAVSVLSGYMVGTALISLFGAVTSALIMVLLGLPLALPIGVLTFFGGFIPYVGSFVTTALAFLVAVAVGTTTDIVIMFVYTIVFNLIQGSFVAPIVYGRALSLHPAIVLVAVPVGSAVAGILGMFLVVPIVAIVSATWRLVVATIEDDAPAATPEPDPPDRTRGAAAPAGT